ncbi:protein LATERAL ORGAN BOUNDARIES [Cucumis sativus]|uniref:protein LATERAL ORGAN BOUNDARIES n=1 Tax=Cucumis sativus TaxID=3659 RepID=UPI0002B49140|nr:protein LATERAL ORGAN BOUNDARIES [Cucumis sativus]
MSSSNSQSQKIYGSPCASCKFLRRKCDVDCIFAPYFPADQPQKFEVVHRIYGASNVSKILKASRYDEREETVKSLVFEAEARLEDPVHGCVAFIAGLQQRLQRLQTELAIVQQQLLSYMASQLPPNSSYMASELPPNSSYMASELPPNSSYMLSELPPNSSYMASELPLNSSYMLSELLPKWPRESSLSQQPMMEDQSSCRRVDGYGTTNYYGINTDDDKRHVVRQHPITTEQVLPATEQPPSKDSTDF